MIFSPDSSALAKHIDYYWVMKDAPAHFESSHNLMAFPGITPDMLLVLDGNFSYDYRGKKHSVYKSQLYSFIHDTVKLDFSGLKSFVLIKFKSRGLSSLLPFVASNAKALMDGGITDADLVFGNSVNTLSKHLRALDETKMVAELDQWFLGQFKKEREGFIVDLAGELSANYDLKEMMRTTKYSYSTLERYFKKDTGLSPKKFQSLRRYKRAVHEICITQNTDWMHYVAGNGYYDQSHFIKEIKRYTSYTPAQLLELPTIVRYRPLEV